MIDLNKIDKKEIFQVPENYFEEMQEQVLAKIRHQKIKSRNNRVLVAITSIAATFLLIFSLLHFIPQPDQGNLALTGTHESLSEMLTDTGSTESVMPDEVQVTENRTTNWDIAINRVSSVMPKETSTLAQVIENVELDNLDYQILEYYQEDISLMDLY